MSNAGYPCSNRVNISINNGVSSRDLLFVFQTFLSFVGVVGDVTEPHPLFGCATSPSSYCSHLDIHLQHVIFFRLVFETLWKKLSSVLRFFSKFCQLSTISIPSVSRNFSYYSSVGSASAYHPKDSGFESHLHLTFLRRRKYPDAYQAPCIYSIFKLITQS